MFRRPGEKTKRALNELIEEEIQSRTKLDRVPENQLLPIEISGPLFLTKKGNDYDVSRVLLNVSTSVETQEFKLPFSVSRRLGDNKQIGLSSSCTMNIHGQQVQVVVTTATEKQDDGKQGMRLNFFDEKGREFLLPKGMRFTLWGKRK